MARPKGIKHIPLTVSFAILNPAPLNPVSFFDRNPVHKRILYSLAASLLLLLCLVSTGLSAPQKQEQQELLGLVSGGSGQLDLTRALLLISRDWDPAVDAASFRNKLDTLTATVREKLKGHTAAAEIVRILADSIHKDGGYGFTDMVDPQGIPLNPAELFMHGLLQSRRGYCMNLSLLYLIVGDRLNLPLHGVALPNHFFVRYDDGKYRANIEATQDGATFPDSFYRERFLQDFSGDPSYFLANLDKKQTLGAYFNNVGMVMFRARRADDAVFYLEQSTALNPKALDALNNLANLYSEQKQYDRAVSLYRKALETDSNNWQTYFNLGIALAEAGKEDDAITAFTQAAQINPLHAPSHNVLARLYMEKEKWTRALIHLKKLVELEPQNPGHRLRVGHAYLRMDQPALALEWLQETQRLFPLNLDINELMAEAHYRLKQYPAAITQLEFIIERSPQMLHAHVQLGWILFLQDKIGAAIEHTKRGLSDEKSDDRMKALAQMNLGLYSLVEGKTEEAEAWYGKVLALKEAGLTDAMTQDLIEAAGRFQNRPEISFFTGWIFSESGNPDKALPYLMEYLNKQSQGPLADRARQMIKQAEQHAPLPKENPAREKPEEKPPEDMAFVPSGFFIMGSDHHGEDENPRHKVFLDAFYIDKTEVSNQDFADFMNSLTDPDAIKSFYKMQKASTLFYDGNGFKPLTGSGNYPANSITWYGAKAYCESQGKRLPREAEWEKAARGEEGLTYPWGNEQPTPERARYFQTWTEENHFRVMVPVDSMPEGRSPYGAYHMLGNVKEWVDDWFDREYYKDENHKLNPQGPIGGEFRVLRGGSWRDLRSVLYSSFRNNGLPESGMDDYGFRCAKSVGPVIEPGRLAMREDGALRR